MASKKLILAVDDDVSIRELYEQGLPLYGFEIACAENAAQARAFLLKRRPDMILMDIMMPDQDGISFTQELRGEPDTAEIPILMVSGLADAATVNDALLFGAVDYVVKPVDLESLKRKIEELFLLLEKRRPRPPGS